MILLSIIICTHRRIDLLRNCVDSLIDQNAERDLFEIIVVDNDLNPNNEIINIVSNAAKYINIQYLFEPVLGLSQARNSGGKISKGQYIGYIDDDAKADKSYITNALIIINDTNPDYFGGPYFPYYISKKPNWFKDEYESGFPALTDGPLNENQFLNGTNMIYKRTLLESLNWFDTNFGMKGTKVAYGEETDFQLRAIRKNSGISSYYSNSLIVYHVVMPLKLKLFDRCKRKYQTGYSQAYMWLKPEQHIDSKRRSVWRLTKQLILFVLVGLPMLLFRDKKKYPFWQNYAYEILAQYFASIGQEYRYSKDFILNK